MSGWLVATFLLATTPPAQARCKIIASGDGDRYQWSDLGKVARGTWVKSNVEVSRSGVGFNSVELTLEVVTDQLPGQAVDSDRQAGFMLSSGTELHPRVTGFSPSTYVSRIKMRLSSDDLESLMQTPITRIVVPFDDGDLTVSLSGGKGKKLAAGFACYRQ